MKTLRSLLLLTAFAVVAFFIGAPFVMEINPLVDAPPAPIVVAEPAPPIAVAPPVDERSHLLPAVAANVPLGKSLILREAVPVRTKYGAVTVGAGTPVALAGDEGATVRVRWQEAEVRVPREAVAPGAPLAPVQQASTLPPPVARVMTFWRPPPATPAPSTSSLGIEAREIGTARGQADSWKTDWGSYDRDISRRKTILAEVRNIGSAPSGPLQVSIYWIAATLAEKRRYVHHHDVFNLAVEPVSFVRQTSQCPELRANVQNYAALGEKYVAGARMDGWIATLSSEGKRIATVASSDGLRLVVSSEGQFLKLLAEKPDEFASRKAAR